MKFTCKLSAFLLVAIMLFNTAHAQKTPFSVCFSDGFGYTWTFSNITLTSDHSYYAEGNVTAYPSSKATIWLDIANGIHSASVEIHAVNLNPDGCTSYSDSFVYVGSADITRGISYSGSGSWTSFCTGGVINAGTWAASGPCGGRSIQKINTSGPLPAKPVISGSQKNDSKTSLRVIPNPVTNNTTLQYAVVSAGKVNITIYNYMHEPVKVLVNENKSAGNYSVNWDALHANGSRVNTGLYQVVMLVGNKTQSTTIQVL